VIDEDVGQVCRVVDRHTAVKGIGVRIQSIDVKVGRVCKRR
jgi:hypothetical protein